MKKNILIIITFLFFRTFISAQSVGIGSSSFTPLNMLDVKGKMVIGSGYAGVNTAPADGLLIQGSTGIGTSTITNAKLQIQGSGTYDGVLRLINTESTNGTNVFFVASNSAWTFGSNKLGIGIGDPSSANVKMTIQSNGNVGIGTTSPGFKLDVNGIVRVPSGNYYSFENWQWAIGKDMSTQFSSNEELQVMGYGSSGNSFQIIGVSGVSPTYTYSRILQANFDNGRVGIGTNPTNSLLEVNGGIRILTSPSGDLYGSGLILNDESNSSLWHQIHIHGNRIRAYDGSTEDIYVTTTDLPTLGTILAGSGTSNYLARWTGQYTLGTGLTYDNGTNVGIGTTSPTSKLHVYQTGALAEMMLQSNGHDGATAGGRILFNNDVLGNSQGNITFVNDGFASNYLKTGISFFSDAITINADGPFASRYANLAVGTTLYVSDVENGTVVNKVGIGTSTPNDKLQIYAGLLRFNDLHIKNNLSIPNSCGGNYYANAHSGIYAMDYSGGCGDEWFIAEIDRDGGEASTLVISQQNDADDHIALIPSGNVGIGTTSPGYKLEVNGQIHSASRLSSVNTRTYFLESLTGNYGEANGYSFAETGVIIESGYGESGGFQASGANANIWSPGDNDILRIYDEDGMNLRAYLDGSGYWYSYGNYTISDIKMKENIRKINSPLNKILQLNGVLYDLKKDLVFKGEIEEGKKFDASSIINQYGFIAQDVEKIIPEIVSQSENWDIKTINYQGIIPIMVEAMKEQQKQIEIQKTQIEQLMKEIEAIKKEK